MYPCLPPPDARAPVRTGARASGGGRHGSNARVSHERKPSGEILT
jgi:hypothetical protein